MKQTLSKHQGIRAHVAHVYFECICLMIARCLLDCVNGVWCWNAPQLWCGNRADSLFHRTYF